jgi:farnesyl diphosphate synthase
VAMSLHSHAFEVARRKRLGHWPLHLPHMRIPFVRAELIAELARASGPSGMAGGQMMDLMAAEAGAGSGRRHQAPAAQDRAR